MRSPINWFGGKGKMLKKILPVLAGIPHKRYCEPFGGGAALTKQARVECLWVSPGARRQLRMF